ncbi:MAG: hypothetical protein U0931_03730 [Vulcanimicrobiota bacterium]
MDKVYCKTRRVIIEHSKGGPLLDVEYVPDASYTWEQVTAFFKHGKFALKFDGPEGTVTIQPVEVETATSLTDQPGILVGLGKNDPKRIPPGMDAWLERSDR